MAAPRLSATAPSFSFESRLRASAHDVWMHATTMAGVNRELFPLARMTAPAGRRSFAAEDIVCGERVFRSWILAFAVLPVDYDDLTFVEFEAPRRFLERSTMLSQRVWQHERVVEEASFGCVIRDRVCFEPRVAALAAVQLPLFRLVFRNRHRRLARLFGSAPRSPDCD